MSMKYFAWHQGSILRKCVATLYACLATLTSRLWLPQLRRMTTQSWYLWPPRWWGHCQVSIPHWCSAVGSLYWELMAAATVSQHVLYGIKCIYVYLAKMKHRVICICASEPDYSELPDQDFDWMHTVYGDHSEIIPLMLQNLSVYMWPLYTTSMSTLCRTLLLESLWKASLIYSSRFYWLVLQETSNSKDWHIWFWICGCLDLNWAGCWPSLHPLLPWSPHTPQELHVWWQQDCGR